MKKKFLIGFLVLAVILAGLGFLFNGIANKENRELRLLDRECFARIEKAEELFREEKYDAALEKYKQALKYAESNKELVGEEVLSKMKFKQAMSWYFKAEVFYDRYAESLVNPQATQVPKIEKVLELYKKPVEIFNEIKQVEGFNWGCYVLNNKANSLVYQIFIYLYLKSELEAGGSNQRLEENARKAKEYEKTAMVLYKQAFESYCRAHDLVNNPEDRKVIEKNTEFVILVKQNIEFLTRDSTEQAFQQGDAQGKEGQQRGLGFLAQAKGEEGEGRKVEILPLPLGKKGQKGTSKAEKRKGKK